MLSVIYELVPSTTTGRLAHYSEARGAVRVEVVDGHHAPDLLPDLNQGMQELLDGSRWFQLWRKDIIGRSGGTDCSLDVRFRLVDLDPGDYVQILEVKGLVIIGVERTATAAQFVQAINPAIVHFLAGGQWFQVFAGEIVDMSSPDTVSHI
ncbi:hypothetical protein ABZ819_04825 [Streptomyces venezuelae]|uniref:hypothetical protein n=1 Tax=Streptomyces venezuelae TaxID=54571 RepID=UPI0034179828